MLDFEIPPWSLFRSCCLFQTNVTFLEAKLLEWQNGVLEKFGASMESAPVYGTLDAVLHKLDPLTSPTASKVLLIGAGDGWTVLLDNGRRGTDAGYSSILSERCACRGLRVVAKHESKLPKRYGAVIFEVYDHGADVRTVYCANDGGKWKFGATGEPFAFEDVARYERRSVKDRFTTEMLFTYLSAMKINMVDKDWYEVSADNPAVLLKRVGQFPVAYTEYPLSDS